MTVPVVILLSIMASYRTYLDLVQIDLQNRCQVTNGGVLVDRHKYFVEESLKIVPLDPVHYEPLQGGHHNVVIVVDADLEVDQPSVIQLCKTKRQAGFHTEVWGEKGGHSHNLYNLKQKT